MKLVECVPNFSEGRRPEVVAAIVDAGARVPGVTVLGAESDRDHNRTVVTLAGAPDAVSEAAFRMTAEARRLIDLNTHEGAHPRMGATDVIPFIPLRDVTMEDCIALAKRLAERIGRELDIPCFLYADAAAVEERRSLPKIREGGFEGLRTRIGTDPTRVPDTGPHAIHPTAGCTAVGARFFLVAYNVNLGTTDPALAKSIAADLRESGRKVKTTAADGSVVDTVVPGKFKKLQAAGFELKERGLTQVSMNLLDYRITSVADVYAEIEKRAADAGVTIVESELVGLLPREALLRTATERVKLSGFKDEQVIEHHLDRARDDAFTCFDPFLEALASGAPTPGGGSAAALVGALGAALGAMVTNLTIGKKKFVAVEADMLTARTWLMDAVAALRAGVKEDALLFDRVMAAYKLPKTTPAEEATRKAAVEEATLIAAHGPFGLMKTAAATLPTLLETAEKGNPAAASDAAVGALLVRACVEGAAYNVMINVGQMKGHPEADGLAAATATLRADVATRTQAVLDAVDRRI